LSGSETRPLGTSIRDPTTWTQPNRGIGRSLSAINENAEATTETFVARTDFAPGHRIDRYELRELIGRGGMGSVYRAVDTRLGRTVALKTVAARRSGARLTDRVRQRFLREAMALSKVEHRTSSRSWTSDSPTTALRWPATVWNPNQEIWLFTAEHSCVLVLAIIPTKVNRRQSSHTCRALWVSAKSHREDARKLHYLHQLAEYSIYLNHDLQSVTKPTHPDADVTAPQGACRMVLNTRNPGADTDDRSAQPRT
jgi:hypothetical protein